MVPLHDQPAFALADRVRRGELRASDLLEDSLARIAEHDPEIGAFVFLDPATARTRAAAVDRSVGEGRDPGPLAGLPLGVKVLEDVEGWPHTLAARVFADRIATTTSTHVVRLMGAGAIPVGLTASPELGSASHTSSQLYGVCRNPWNPDLTPGGSSGGSAAAVAAGLVPLATGSDSGGSLRIPAAYSGVFGFKGTYGRVPRGPGYVGFPNVRSYGVLTRCVRDTARVLDCVAGVDERDPLSLPHPGPSFEACLETAPVEGLAVAWTDDLGFGACDPGVAVQVRAAATELSEALGFRESGARPVLPDPELAWRVLGAPDVVGLYAPFLPERADEIAPFVRDLAVRGADLETSAYGEAAQVRNALVQRLAEIFEDTDLLLLPTVACPAFAAEGPTPGTIGGETVSLLRSVAQTYVFNLSGHPAASVPIGSLGGAPIGLQIVGRRHDDLRVLAVAAAWERIRPWPVIAARMRSGSHAAAC